MAEVTVSTERPHRIPVHFLLVWRAGVRHGDVRLALRRVSSWRVLGHCLVARVGKAAVRPVGATHLLVCRLKHRIHLLGRRAAERVTLLHVGLTLRGLQGSLVRLGSLWVILLLSLIEAWISIQSLDVLLGRLVSFLHFLV